LEAASGATIQLDIQPYDALHQKILLNSQSAESPYDIVSVDIVWEGEFGAAGALMPLDDFIAKSDIDLADFPQTMLEGAQYEGKQMGLPVQPHPEILWYRKDLFEEKGIEPPETTDELLAAAKAFHDPDNGFYGIGWNGARGQALGQQMAHFYAAFDQKLFDENWMPTLDGPGGVAAGQYALDLMQYSPPDILNMAWDERVRLYAQGKTAMIYGWAARAFMIEDPEILANTGFIATPHAPGKPAVNATGEWSLSIPSNVQDPELAWSFLKWLTDCEQLKALALAGNGGMPRYCIIRDPELMAKYPAFEAVDKMATEGILQMWMRPAIPEWPVLADTLGTVFHEMLAGSLTPEEAAAKAQETMVQVMTDAGYFDE
jgi:multiple sugar transport system substrate-binding protein